MFDHEFGVRIGKDLFLLEEHNLRVTEGGAACLDVDKCYSDRHC